MENLRPNFKTVTVLMCLRRLPQPEHTILNSNPFLDLGLLEGVESDCLHVPER